MSLVSTGSSRWLIYLEFRPGGRTQSLKAVCGSLSVVTAIGMLLHPSAAVFMTVRAQIHHVVWDASE